MRTSSKTKSYNNSKNQPNLSGYVRTMQGLNNFEVDKIIRAILVTKQEFHKNISLVERI